MFAGSPRIQIGRLSHVMALRVGSRYARVLLSPEASGCLRTPGLAAEVRGSSIHSRRKLHARASLGISSTPHSRRVALVQGGGSSACCHVSRPPSAFSTSSSSAVTINHLLMITIQLIRSPSTPRFPPVLPVPGLPLPQTLACKRLHDFDLPWRMCKTSPGASRGIGLEFVRQLLGRPGCSVIATCRDPSNSMELQELMRANPSRLRILQLDLLDPTSIQVFPSHNA